MSAQAVISHNLLQNRLNQIHLPVKVLYFKELINKYVIDSKLIIFSVIEYFTYPFFVQLGIANFNWVFQFFKKC